MTHNPIMQLLQELSQKGIQLRHVAGKLQLECPKGVMTPALSQSIKSNKDDIIKWLSANEEADRQTSLNQLPQVIADDSQCRQPFPLSDLQRGFLMAEDPFMEFHVRPHLYMEFRLRDLDAKRYMAAWNKALQRHQKELLQLTAEQTLQWVGEYTPLPYKVIDLTKLPADQVEQKQQRIRQEMMRSQLPLDRWPWLDLRISLYHQDGERWGCVHYNHNNFFADGAGTGRLLKEVQSYYQQPELTLPPLQLSTRDAILALDALAQTPAGQRDRQYWEDRLPDLPEPPALPTRAGMNRRVRSTLNRREFFLSAERWRAIKEQAGQHGLTPSAAIFAIYAEVLAAWSNQSHFVLSNMITRRLDIHPDIWQILGNFVSLYPLEVDLRHDHTFAARALRLQQQTIRDSQHLRWGGMQVMQALNQRNQSFGRAPIPFVISSGLAMTEYDKPDFSCLETSQVMLDHQFWELSDGRLYIVWDLLEAFFPDGLIDAMSQAYLKSLVALAEDADYWLMDKLPLQPEQQEAVRQSVLPPARILPGWRLERLLDRVSGKERQNTALVSGTGNLSYQQLLDISLRLAQELRQQGIKEDDKVVVCLPPGPGLLASVYAILKAGAVYVPVSPELPLQRRLRLAQGSQAQAVITTPSQADSWPATMACVCWTADRLDHSEPAEPLVRNVNNRRTAYMIYTSGSTGEPKAVMIDHQGALNTILDINQRFQVTTKDCILGVSACGFDLSIYDLFGTVDAGATLVYPDPERAKDPDHWLDLMLKEQVTVWNSAPPLMSLLVESAELRGISLPHLRLVMLSGDWIPVTLPDRIRALAPNARVISLGGATEASIWSIYYPVDEVNPDWSSIPYGFPMINQPWFILDQWGRATPDYTTGELYIGGIGLAQGYWQDEEKTSRAFIAHPVTGERIYRTGDLGRYLPDGSIEFLGRSDSQIKVQGHRIELGEIESTLDEMEYIRHSAVIVRQDNHQRTNVLVAYVVSTQPQLFEVQPLRAELARHLPDYMVPSEIYLLEHLPLTGNGKLDRRQLEQWDTERKDNQIRAQVDIQPPQTPLQKYLHQLWCQLLKIEDEASIGILQDFFDMGGQSFEAIRMITNLREKYQVSLSLGDLWQTRTIATLATFVEERLGDQHTKRPLELLVQINRQTKGTPLFMIHPAGGHIHCYQALGSHMTSPLYGFQAPGVDGISPTLSQIPDLAQTYLERLLAQDIKGPYLLGGWSSGGLIAFEMARQLEHQGRKVAGVVILDSPPPLNHQPVTDLALLDWFLEDLNLPTAILSDLHGRDRDQTPAMQLQQVSQILQHHQHTLADPGQLQAMHQVFADIVRGSRLYQGGQVHCPLLLLRAQRGRVSEFAQHPYQDTPDWGWQAFSEQKVTSYFLDGTHYDLLSGPNLQTLMQHLQAWRNRHQSTANPNPALEI